MASYHAGLVIGVGAMMGMVGARAGRAALAVATLAMVNSWDSGARAAEPPVTVMFTATPVPATDAERASVLATSTAILGYADGTKRTVPLAYRPLYHSGDRFAGGVAGRVQTNDGKPLLRSAPIGKDGAVARGPFLADGVDGSSLLQVPGAKAGTPGANRLFLLTHFEYNSDAANAVEGGPRIDTRRKLPMTVGLGGIDQDAATGELRVATFRSVDLAGVGGLWTPCAATQTPWNTHFGGEEYEPDAAALEGKPFEPMNLYLGSRGKTAAEGGANPYDYGHPFEIAVGADGSTKVAKRWALGRMSLEFAEIMPDRRTVYLADDGKDVGRFMFVADREGDLSSGRLYAARWEQSSGDQGGAATLRWIFLGHGSEEAVRALAAARPTFSSIFEQSTKPAEGFVPVYAYAGDGGKTALAHLRVKPGREMAAAFLESRRFAALKGATTEFTKTEGQAVSVRHRKLYTSLATLSGGMLDGQNANRPADHIRLSGDAADLQCGAIYESDLRGGQVDTDGAAIASDWVAATMRAVLTGARKPADQKAGPYDACDSERMANPDNIKYSDTLDTLFIEEDADYHLNNFVWAWRPGDNTLVRLFSAPAGAENTGLQVVENVNGFAYLTVNVAHPGAPHVLKDFSKEVQETMGRLVDRRGIVGVIGPLPALAR